MALSDTTLHEERPERFHSCRLVGALFVQSIAGAMPFAAIPCDEQQAVGNGCNECALDFGIVDRFNVL